MKKLMVVAFAIASSVIANAASINWATPFGIADGTLTGLTTATMAYLIDADVLSAETIYTSVKGGKTLADSVAGKALKSAALTDGSVGTLTAWDAGSSYSAGDSLTAYMVLFDDDLNALYFSETSKQALHSTMTRTYSFSADSSADAPALSMDGFSASSGGWVAVPEPTSGLLLVLGMAGLMLRRRRA